MGTRNLTCVVIDGQHKIAQYGQWDGYPAGVGSDIARFLLGLSEAEMDTFKARVRALEFVGVDYLDKYGLGYVPPEFNRNTAAGILPLVLSGEVTKVFDNWDFGHDSLFCEWAYVIDLDSMTLEVYKGFQQETPTQGKWANHDNSSVALVKTIPLPLTDAVFDELLLIEEEEAGK